MIEKDIKIIFNKRIAPKTFLMGFRSPEIAEESRPGQFVMIRVRAEIDPLLRRPFSICGIQKENLVCILYRVVGRGTAIMSEKGAGERLSVMGPLGNGFGISQRNKKILLVGGGIGVAPLFFLAQTVKAMDIEFMMGFGSSKEIIDADQFCDMPINISFATDDGTKGYAGMITDLLDEYLQKGIPEDDSFYMYSCGPLNMLKRVASIASDFNIPCQVSMEATMACGLGACQGCAVKAPSLEGKIYYHRVCKDGPVFSIEAIDWKNL